VYLDLYDQLMDDARRSLGPAKFDQTVSDGVQLAWDEAIAEALEYLAQAARKSDSDATEPTDDDSQLDRAPAAVDQSQTQLTARQLEVLRYIALGDSNKDIARAIGVSPKTVMHHSVSIYQKLCVRGRAEATAVAIRSGLVPGPSSSGLGGR
jgi:DNA-binding NarL/FixJ family response regulator